MARSDERVEDVRATPCKVVLVDDAGELRALIKVMLKDPLGRIEVVGEAADGVEGLEVIRRMSPDVVLLDVAMPKMDGLTVLSRLRAQGDSTKVMMVTAFDGPLVREAASAAGADAYFDKGDPLHLLSEMVLSLCRR